jgi:hypothetical protein
VVALVAALGLSATPSSLAAVSVVEAEIWEAISALSSSLLDLFERWRL